MIRVMIRDLSSCLSSAMMPGCNSGSVFRNMRQPTFNDQSPQPDPRSGFVRITLMGVAGLLGILLMLALTPTLQYRHATQALHQAELLLEQHNPGEAVQHLFALAPLLEFFPELIPPFRGHLIRAYTQAGHLDEAFALSQKPPGWTGICPSSFSAPLATVSPLVRFSFRFPVFGKHPLSTPYAGKSDITIFQDQLVSLNRWDLFLPYDPATPPPTLTPAQPVQPIPTPVEPVQPIPLAATPKTISPIPETLPPPPPPPPPREETRDRLDKNLAHLTGQLETISNQLVAARADLIKAANPILTPAQTAAKNRQQKATLTVNRFIDENIRLKNEMDKASGARRVGLLDQLKARRYQEQGLQRELQNAKAACEKLLPPTNPKIDLEIRIEALTDEYHRTGRQIEATRKELEQVPEPKETMNSETQKTS